jgi:CRP-like cAMP-binding protein
MPSGKTAKAALTGRNGQAIHNKLLLGLTGSECARVLEKLEYVATPVHTVLLEAEEPIKFAYFINEGLSSVLNVMTDGKSVEVGLNGVEGFVGTPLLAGFKTSPTTVVMQVGGSAFRMSAKDFTAALTECPQLAVAMNRFMQLFTLQTQQIAACNRLHNVEERLARWLLMCQDRIGGDVVPLTQQFLAHMLATRRASVTIAAGTLQKAGLITYTRGVVVVKDREMLENASCECYDMLVRQTRKWKDEVAKPSVVSG